MPPIIILREQAARIEQHRAIFEMLLPGVPISAAWAVADILSLGLDDLKVELVDLGQQPRNQRPQVVHDGASSFFAVPAPPRGSRWAPRKGRPAQGFVKLASMWLPADLAQDLTETLATFHKVVPGLVASRAALVREALARGIARLDAQKEMNERVAQFASASSDQFGPPAVGVIKLSALIPARGRPPKRVGKRTKTRAAKRKAPRRKTRRRVTRANRRARSRGDPDPEPAQSRRTRGAP